MDEALIEQAGRKVWEAQRLLLVSHIRPDGDAVGSLIGLGLALQEAGKSVQWVLTDGIPASTRHLPGVELVARRPEGEFDFAVAVDCSDLNRVGEALNGYGQPDLNIDHHITNLKFARYNLVQPEAASTAEMLARILPAWGFRISQPIATALLTGIISDTLGFRTSNVTPETLRIAANLMETGGDLATVYHEALLQPSFNAARYWGAGLSKIQFQDRLVWTALTLDDRRAAKYPGRDDADLINLLSSIEEADISIVFVEQTRGHVKVSWRSRPGFDVAQIALRFGGGGHKAAAGADVPGTLEEIQTKVLEATRALLKAA
jgi:phosphoesterase RecJ-like protein